MQLQYETSGRPFAIQPYQYQSTFTPIDLGVVQHGLESRQNRYDAANAAWAETKGKLYDDPTYDKAEKDRVVQAIEGNFENVYKNYNGDLGAATGDLMQMIANTRKNEYFALNKVALEKQKEYEALKRAYGAKALEFKGMPKGLRNEKGELRSQEEFAPIVIQDLERDEKLASIINQSLKEVSRESGLKGSGVSGLLMTKTTKDNFTDQASKRESIYQEYLKTPEGQLHMKILTEHPEMKVKDPKAILKDYVNKAIDNRIAPESISTQYIGDPGFDAGSGQINIPYNDLYTPATVTAKSSNSIFRNADAIVTYANKKDNSFESKLAREKLNRIVNSNGGVQYKEMIKLAAKRAGIEPSKILNDDGFLALTPSGKLPNYWNVEEVNKMAKGSKEDREVLNAHIQGYNNFLKEALKANDYQNFVWNTFDIGKAMDIGGTKLGGAVKMRGDATLKEIKDLGINQWIFEDSKLSGKTEFSEDEKKNFDISSAYQGYDPSTGNYALMIKTSDGEQHIVRPKSIEQALHIARTSGDPNAIEAAMTSNIEFAGNTVGILRNGVFEQKKLPDDVTVEEVGDGAYIVKDKGYSVMNNGYPLTRYETAKYLNKYLKEPSLNDR